jgi:hypothetical protein
MGSGAVGQRPCQRARRRRRCQSGLERLLPPAGRVVGGGRARLDFGNGGHSCHHGGRWSLISRHGIWPLRAGVEGPAASRPRGRPRIAADNFRWPVGVGLRKETVEWSGVDRTVKAQLSSFLFVPRRR